MDTLSHGLWGYLVFRKNKGLKGFLVGTIFPDLPFIVGSLALVLEQKKLPDDLAVQVVVDQRIAMFGVPLHSFVVWALFAIIGIIITRQLIPFVLGWGFHLILDIFTHVSDATPLFWPISQERYRGLISYWELEHYALLFNITNVSLLSAAYLWLLYNYLRKKS